MRPTPAFWPLATIGCVLLLLAAAPLLLAEAPQATPVRIVCLGDSVTKAVRPGVGPEETFCAVLQRDLRAAGHGVEVVNAGVGGNKTSDGLARSSATCSPKNPTTSC